MSQNRFTEGGRSIVWKAVQEALNGHRRRDPLAKGLFLKFERIDWSADSQKPDWWEDWEPGQPDKPQLSEDDIQAFIADIAADVCRRVEETLDKIDPREAEKPVEKSAEEKAKERWVSGPVKVWDGPSGSEVTVDALAEDQPLGGQSLSHVTKAAWNEVRRREREDAIHPCTNWRADICDCKGACSCHWVQPEETIKRTEIPIKRLGSTEEVRLHGPVIKGAPGKPGKHSDAIEASKPVEWPEGELVEVEATESMGPAAVHDAALDEIKEALKRGAEIIKKERPVAMEKPTYPAMLKDSIPDYDISRTLGCPPDLDAPLDKAQKADPEVTAALMAAQSSSVGVAAYSKGDVKPWKPVPKESTFDPQAERELITQGIQTLTAEEVNPDSKWQAWKKCVRGRECEWMTIPEYIHDTRELAERHAEGFKRQLSVVDVKVLPVGVHPEPTKLGENDDGSREP
jgi:hypothetical protein